jgi:hypothetical protein
MTCEEILGQEGYAVARQATTNLGLAHLIVERFSVQIQIAEPRKAFRGCGPQTGCIRMSMQPLVSCACIRPGGDSDFEFVEQHSNVLQGAHEIALEQHPTDKHLLRIDVKTSVDFGDYSAYDESSKGREGAQPTHDTQAAYNCGATANWVGRNCFGEAE